jgi:hypothetical protein
MKRRRDIHQRRAYAVHRASLAVDRLTTAKTTGEKFQAIRWAQAWGELAGIRPGSRPPHRG